MTYTKPEINVLGDTASLILGSKGSKTDNGSFTDNLVGECDLDD